MTARSWRRPLCLLGALTAVCTTAAVGLAPAATADRAVAMIRGGHFSPDTPGVDVYLTAFHGGTTKLWLSSVGYGDVSAYQGLTPGQYAVSMRPHGAAASSPAALSWTLDARGGAAYTACAVGMNADLQGIVLDDNLSMTPTGKARVRVIQAASSTHDARVALSGGPTLAASVAFAATTKYSTVPAGRHTVVVTANDKAGLRTSADVDFKADTVHTIVVLDRKSGGITVHTLDDATGATAPPGGAVPAGGGGTAGSAGGWPGVGLLALLAAALLAVGATTTIGRTRR
jgi:hypothetical protein